MKYLVLLGLFTSQLAFANFVYMKEDAQGKSVLWQDQGSAPTTLNQRENKLWALYPDVTPNGQEFVYLEGEGPDNLHLVYVNKQKNLTQKFTLPEKGMLMHPKFSKNGRYIFYSAPGPKGKNTLFFFERDSLVRSQGQGLSEYSLATAQMLVPDEEAYFPRPSSDGNFVVYQRNQAGKKEIVLYDRIENTKKVLAEGNSPALSFDERLIAYTSKKEGNWNIYTIDRVSGEIKQMTSDLKDEMAPTFMPDNTLVFASNQSGRFRLFKLQDTKWVSLLNVAENAEVDFYSPNFSGETAYKQQERAPFIGNPRSSFGTVSHEGKIYMAGGHQGAEHTYPPESFTDTFIAYDIENNEWEELAPRPRKAHGYQLAAYGNYIYAFGGFAYSADHKPRWKSLREIDRYDIKLNKWETIGMLNVPRSSNVAVRIANKVYIAAGWDSTPKFYNDADGTFHASIEVFDLKTEKIEIAPYKLPLKRRALTGIEHQGKIVLVGGISEGASHFDLLNKVTAIDPQDGSISEMQPLPFATFAPAAEIINNELMVFGGMYKTGPMSYEYVSHIYALDLNQTQWRHTGRFLKETKGFSQVFKVDKKTLGILGGHHYFEGMDSPVSTFETISK